MNYNVHSNSTGRYQSTISKSSNSSVSSILRDSSTKRTKKQHSVRFEDSPVELEKTVHINLSSFSSQQVSPSLSPSPTHSYMHKPISIPPKSNNFPTSPQRKFSQSPPKPVKAYSVQEAVDCSQVEDPRFTPKLISYSFRTNGFYEKLNKFYSSPDEKAQNSKSPINKLENSPKTQKTPEKEEKILIRLRPCGQQEKKDQVKNSPKKKTRNFYNPNILN